MFFFHPQVASVNLGRKKPKSKRKCPRKHDFFPIEGFPYSPLATKSGGVSSLAKLGPESSISIVLNLIDFRQRLARRRGFMVNWRYLCNCNDSAFEFERDS